MKREGGEERKRERKREGGEDGRRGRVYIHCIVTMSVFVVMSRRTEKLNMSFTLCISSWKYNDAVCL